MIETIVAIAYLVAIVLFIFGIKMLGRADTARRGNMVSALGMLTGYSIIAVPTAIVTTKLYERLNRRNNNLDWNCPNCAMTGHTRDASFCKHCGADLEVPEQLRADPDD